MFDIKHIDPFGFEMVEAGNLLRATFELLPSCFHLVIYVEKDVLQFNRLFLKMSKYRIINIKSIQIFSMLKKRFVYKFSGDYSL